MNMEFRERPIDRQAAAFLCRGATGNDASILRLVVSLLSQAVGQGDVCIGIDDIASVKLTDGEELDVSLPETAELYRMLGNLPSVGRPGERRPLVLDAAGRLYLYRYWRYEQLVAAGIVSGCALFAENIDPDTLSEGLERLFPSDGERGEDRQRRAAEAGVLRHLSVISGGPGTGKTSTVVRILALLLEQPDGLAQRIAMAAPTGKAAARLKASIASMRDSLRCDESIKKAIPAEVTTIHRLLGSLPGASAFRHHAGNPLPYDTVIVDEASMIDLSLMSALLTALPGNSRLILLGDRHQLSSVEAGAVLGDICKAGETPGALNEGSVTILERNFRFREGSGIAELSNAVNSGNPTETMQLLNDEARPAIRWRQIPEKSELRPALATSIIDGYRAYLEAGTPAEALSRFDRFRVLCALREGPWGVTGLNRTVESLLAAAGLIEPTGDNWRGRPVLVTENDYMHKLFNGDIGIILPDGSPENILRAFFPMPDGSIRTLPSELLPEHETAFAMTVHKSQGSEFDHVLMLLPPTDSPVLTRELVYTGITRARVSIEILGNEPVFSKAVQRRTERRSGLQDALGAHHGV
ncbi:MAG: exodeoxyribonuclease V subunit alpha [Chlorobiaceae bacterium]|nr:exodeoxyribonuclease V subunit alpha [Chlorobiaceae bacterium]NTV25251.1 exodeoxyribonuclease V subunit alpha [Chlorobiaceae bacterium]